VKWKNGAGDISLIYGGGVAYPRSVGVGMTRTASGGMAGCTIPVAIIRDRRSRSRARLIFPILQGPGLNRSDPFAVTHGGGEETKRHRLSLPGAPLRCIFDGKGTASVLSMQE
jgi:hypothetical protein